MLSRSHLIPERYGQTDGRADKKTDRWTDIFAISISRMNMLTHDKNTHRIRLFKKRDKIIQIRNKYPSENLQL